MGSFICRSIAEQEYIKPQFAVDKLREKLQRIDLDITM